MMNLSEKTFITSLLEKGRRPDGRQLFSERLIQIQFMDKSGSILYCQGKTKVVVKVNSEITFPRKERPSEGFINFRVNAQAASRNMDQNKKISIEISKLLDKIIIASNTLDPESLCIISGKYVWQINVECIVVKDDGNLIDAVINGVMAALMDTKKPIVNIEHEQIKLGSKQQWLSLAHTPFIFTFGLIEGSIFIDPVLKQDLVSETLISIGVNVYGEVCCIHKPGGMMINQKILNNSIAICQKKIKGMTEGIRDKIKNRKSVRSFF